MTPCLPIIQLNYHLSVTFFIGPNSQYKTRGFFEGRSCLYDISSIR